MSARLFFLTRRGIYTNDAPAPDYKIEPIPICKALLNLASEQTYTIEQRRLRAHRIAAEVRERRGMKVVRGVHD